jgi:hypothetical protein
MKVKGAERRDRIRAARRLCPRCDGDQHVLKGRYGKQIFVIRQSDEIDVRAGVVVRFYRLFIAQRPIFSA